MQAAAPVLWLSKRRGGVRMWSRSTSQATLVELARERSPSFAHGSVDFRVGDMLDPALWQLRPHCRDGLADPLRAVRCRPRARLARRSLQPLDGRYLSRRRRRCCRRCTKSASSFHAAISLGPPSYRSRRRRCATVSRARRLSPVGASAAPSACRAASTSHRRWRSLR